MGRPSHESEDGSKSYSYADYSAAHNNQLGEQIETGLREETTLLVNAKQRPAVQVKVTNEVESAMTMMMNTMTMRAAENQQQQQQQQAEPRRLSNGNGHENDMTDTQNVMPSIQEGSSSLMSPNTLSIPTRHNFANTMDSDASNSSNSSIDISMSNIDGQMANDEQLLRLQDYNLLYNAERQTYFQLHTSNKPKPWQDNRTNRPGNANSPMTSNRLLQQVVGNTLSAAFGLNTNDGKDGTMAMTTQTVQLYDAASLRQSHYNPFNPTRVIIHGWLGNAHANVYSYLVPAYLRLDEGNYNIFTVDWGRGAIADYITASYRVKPVGLVLAKFLDFLHEEAGMRFEDLQLIGFSMGAHVAGLAAKHVQTGRVRVIRALDPALPFFRYAQEKERLTKQDADYVEVLHTSVGSYGFDRPLGHVDFYANWGSQQPGCFWHECSHWRAFALFKESLQQTADAAAPAFEAKGCRTAEWQQLTRHKQCSEPQQTGKRLHMGGDLGALSMEQLVQREGVYYFETNAKPPYDIRESL
ncbi:hepatic triacylglycerol lipase [Drosophila sulfurigaster albostrigata]|uniref:hepatic triacylglycerol lipase n=1 Tax=Drosophila sulfurigaster albostrigata TaxID=89887 RepID=UPI002D219ED1|nr:hepatic triacylglycerol lipase [Drosophila sulfurigaster albostrigata]